MNFEELLDFCITDLIECGVVDRYFYSSLRNSAPRKALDFCYIRITTKMVYIIAGKLANRRINRRLLLIEIISFADTRRKSKIDTILERGTRHEQGYICFR